MSRCHASTPCAAPTFFCFFTAGKRVSSRQQTHLQQHTTYYYYARCCTCAGKTGIHRVQKRVGQQLPVSTTREREMRKNGGESIFVQQAHMLSRRRKRHSRSRQWKPLPRSRSPQVFSSTTQNRVRRFIARNQAAAGMRRLAGATHGQRGVVCKSDPKETFRRNELHPSTARQQHKQGQLILRGVATQVGGERSEKHFKSVCPSHSIAMATHTHTHIKKKSNSKGATDC